MWLRALRKQKSPLQGSARILRFFVNPALLYSDVTWHIFCHSLLIRTVHTHAFIWMLWSTIDHVSHVLTYLLCLLIWLQVVNGGQSRGPAAAALRHGRAPAADKSVKLLVNYRSTNERHAPLRSAYGNRDFFGGSSSTTNHHQSSTTIAVMDAASAGAGDQLPQSCSENSALSRLAMLQYTVYLPNCK